MTEKTLKDVKFEGEDANAGYASPRLDLIATCFLAVISVLVMVASYALPIPGGLTTAPGLLPFVVAASLLLMALGLGTGALKRSRTNTAAPDEHNTETYLKTLALAGVIAIYISALQLLAFQHDIVVAGLRHRISAFEPVSIVILAVIIHASWRGPLWITILISTLWIAALAAVFQHLFKIPLPGSF